MSKKKKEDKMNETKYQKRLSEMTLVELSAERNYFMQNCNDGLDYSTYSGLIDFIDELLERLETK